MDRNINFLHSKITGFQKEILELKSDISAINDSNTSTLKKTFTEMIEWMDFLDILLVDINENLRTDNSSSYTQLLKTTQRLKSKMDRFFSSNGISKIQVKPILKNEHNDFGIQVIETQNIANFENGTVIEIIREGYLWGPFVLRRAEVITVKNN
jgi:molecular chaperone GrpE (heat shock protein)